MEGKLESFKYDDKIVRMFLIATMVWAGTAFLVGLLAALQMAFWQLNFNLEWLTFSRIRPLHTNAAIFAFAGNAIFAGIYHSSQRLLKTRMWSDKISRIHFWGWQSIILAAAVTLPLGFSQSKEYAELEWPIDLMITVVWVIFGINFFATLAKRREKHIYVSIWFYIATILTVGLLHVVNSIEIPVSFLQSYPVYAGIQDALVQWWYGHNAVAFFLTTPFLGLMYYYIPKAAGRPIYSYRLSIVHFWSLVFIYIWAGPHHLLNTSLPEWAQTLGMVFSLMLWAPSWGGMINGLLTLRGAWHLLREEPIIKFLIAAVTFYGMSTFEGPLLSIKSVSLLAHYTDWIIGHVHSGALGWNGLLTFGMVYYILPKLLQTEMYSKKLMNYHFWVALIGVLTYYISMVSAGITQGLMWKEIGENGYPVYEFVETVMNIMPLYYVRAFGGLLYIAGYLIMVYNVIKTFQKAPKNVEEKTYQAYALVPTSSEGEAPHRRLEGMAGLFSVLAFLAVLVGSVIEIVPTLSIHKYVPQDVKTLPFTALEQEGRDIYVKEGCYVCHSQQILKHESDYARYGAASTIAESMYDHPFQWGSKRTGPDLARVGKKYDHMWHYSHMIDPRSMVDKSIMPPYPWLAEKKVDFMHIRKKLSVLKQLGVPYSDDEVGNADKHAEEQAKEIAAFLEEKGAPKGLENKQIVALIAYLQALGQKTSVGSSDVSGAPAESSEVVQSGSSNTKSGGEE